MRRRIGSAIVSAMVLGVGLVSVAYAQERRPASERSDQIARGAATERESQIATRLPLQENQTAAPRLIKFSGAFTDFAGKAMTGAVEATFALYKQETDEEPLWTETQRVEADKDGSYTVLLGATQPTGIPSDLFRSDDARWLSVQAPGQPQQPRIPLLSVPYALKAAEAEKLAGKSASDFVLSSNLGEQVRQVIQAQAESAGQATLSALAQPGQTKTNATSTAQATAAAGPMLPPSSFSGTNSTQIVSVTQKGTGAGLIATSTQNNAVSGHSTTGNGVYGQTDSATGNSGVVGNATSASTSTFQNGVIGFNAGAGSGVAGIASNSSAGVGVYGQTSNFAGVFGNSVATSGFTNGVYGQTNATSGFVNGVWGHTTSTNGNGVWGTSDATSGYTNGVFGQSASITGTGVFGNATSPNGQASGVYGQSVNWVGVGGQALATSGSPAYGVWGDSLSSDGAGVAGYADATTGGATGVYGHSVSPDGTGVFGVNDSSVGGVGVRGIANASTGNTSGVFGQNASSNGQGVLGVSNAADGGVAVNGFAAGTTGNAYGVMGTTSTTGFGAGVIGGTTASTGTAFGVFAQASSPNGNAVFAHSGAPSGFPTALVGFLESQQGGVAGQFVAHGGAGLILQGLSGPNFNQVFTVDANGNLNIAGNLTVSGTKSSTAKLQNGREVALYAVESPENWFEDFGSAALSNGTAWVPLDSSFAEATNASVAYHVFLTANGDSNGLYVARKTATGFEVREHGGGGSAVAFDYRIVVRRRGYEAMRMAEVHHDVQTSDSSRQHLAQLATSGTLRQAGIAKAQRTNLPQTIRPVVRPSAPKLPKPTVPQVPQAR